MNRRSLSYAQHNELEPNLKKIPHRNGIWGLEAIVNKWGTNLNL